MLALLPFLVHFWYLPGTQFHMLGAMSNGKTDSNVFFIFCYSLQKHYKLLSRTVSETCENAQQLISDQFVIWGTDDCGNPPDNMKCMYSVRNKNFLYELSSLNVLPFFSA